MRLCGAMDGWMEEVWDGIEKALQFIRVKINRLIRRDGESLNVKPYSSKTGREEIITRRMIQHSITSGP